jgi:multiple sugar transport system substrate-binding protein
LRGQARTTSMIIAAIIIIIIIGGLAWYYSSRGGKTTTSTPLSSPTSSPTTSPATAPATSTPTGKVKIVWASTQLVPPKEQAFVKQELLPPFKQETGIDVEFVGMSYSDLSLKLESEEKAGKVTISVIADLHGGLDLFASKGWLEDLSKFPPLSGRTFPKILEDYSHLHGIKAYVPWLTATYVMVVNKKAFDYLPPGLTKEDVIMGTEKWTYDALLAWAKNLYEKTGKKLLGFPAGPHGLFVRFLHGYLYPSFTGAQVKNFDSPDAVKMWNYLKELWKYVNPASTTWDAMADPLLREEVWIAWDHTARIKDAITTKPEDFVVVPTPRGPKGRGFILVIVGLAIPKNAPHEDAAWKLIDYLTRPETEVKILKNVGFFPSVQEAAGAVPEGPLKVLAKGVNNLLNTKDALVAMIPSLGAKGGDFKEIYITAFQRIVLQGQDPASVTKELKPQLLKLFEETGAPLPPPDSG